VWTKRLLRWDLAVLALALLVAFAWGAAFGAEPIRFERAAPRQYGFAGGVTGVGVGAIFLFVYLPVAVMHWPTVAVLLAVAVGVAALGLVWADRRRLPPGAAGGPLSWLHHLAVAWVAVVLGVWPLVLLGYLVL
jgi:hypothetical protein